jgi:hypothetical protein
MLFYLFLRIIIFQMLAQKENSTHNSIATSETTRETAPPQHQPALLPKPKMSFLDELKAKKSLSS